MAQKAKIEEHKDVWVFVEQDNGQIVRVSIELLGEGRNLADKLNVGLTAVVLGDSVEHLANDIISYGADKVLVAEHPLLKEYNSELYTDVIANQAVKEKPEVLIVGASPIGRDLTPRLSYRLNAGCTADCTLLDIDQEKRLLVSTRPAFGGNVMATIICPEHRPQMSTVRPGVMPLPEKNTSRKGQVIKLNPGLKPEDVKVQCLETVQYKTEGSNIQDAKNLVAIGMGAGDKETCNLLSEMAEYIDAKVASSRLAVEAGWFSHDCQVGQTGKTVRPDLYMACGISGTVQHTAGMSDSKFIIAINKDPNAEIFKFAHFGIVGDIKKIVPAIIAELKRQRA